MFTLPDELNGFKKGDQVFYYMHINSADNNNARLHLTQSCISIGINGTKKLHTINGTEIFNAGDLIFYTPGNYLSYQNIDNDGPYQSLMIFFEAQAIRDLSSPFTGKQIFNGNIMKKNYLSVRGDEYVLNFLQSFIHLNCKGNKISVPLQKIKLVELIMYLKEIFGLDFLIENPGIRAITDNQLQKVIENNLNSNLTLEELAFMCNMSLATFKRAFKKIYDTSPGKWLREKKLLWANDQIIRLHRQPKEVFYDAGYEDYASFSYAFKQRFGVSPRQKINLGN
jgi:AraC family transcriptional regulator, exoenzyme S synthesis regulatory protein ExsA